MIKDILAKLGDDKATNRNILEEAINASLKEENSAAKTYLLTLELGEYLEENEKKEFLQKTRPETYLKLHAVARDYMATKDWDKALEVINATLSYIAKLPEVTPPGNFQGETKRYQFNSFTEMLIYCTKNPSENCLWVAKDEIAFLKIKSYCLIEKKDFAGAREALNTILARNPLDVATYLELFETYKMEGSVDEGFKYLEKAYQNVWFIEDYGRMLRAYGYYYLEKGEYEKSKAYYLLSLMYDGSVEADRYVSNELDVIKQKLGDGFRILPPAETAKFMSENKLSYALPQNTEVTLMRVLKKLYELKLDAEKKDLKQAEFLQKTIVSFESNLRRVTLNKTELIDVVKTDIYTNSFMYINSFFRYAFKIDKAFRQMPPENLAKNEETKNILAFMYRVNDKNLVEGFPITIFVDKLINKDEKHEDLVKDYIGRITKNGFTVTAQKEVTLPLGIPATKLVLDREKEHRCSYIFNISERAFGVVSSQVEYEGDINDSYLTELVESWKYLVSNKTKLEEVLDKAFSGYHSLSANGGMSKDRFIKFASEVEFMLARLSPIKNKEDAIWEITGRKLVVGYILKELKMGITRETFDFGKLTGLLNGYEDIVEYFNIDDDVIGYYTRAAITSPEETRNVYIANAKEFLLELQK